MSAIIQTLHVTGKTSDLCAIQAYGPDGEFIDGYEGYVPKFFPGEHYGDYLELHIDVQTGQILNWPKDLSQDVMRRDLKLPEA